MSTLPAVSAQRRMSTELQTAGARRLQDCRAGARNVCGEKCGEGTKRCSARDASLAAGLWIGGPHERATGDLLMALVNWTAWPAT